MRHSIIYFVSAACGTGKTHAACQTIAKTNHITNHIYVAPTLDLIEETRKTLLSMGVTATVITNETHPGHVKKAIIDFLKDSHELGEVVLITWNAYVELPYLNRRDNWQVIIDEVPQLDRFYGWKLPRNLPFLTDYIDIEETTANERVVKVVLKDRDALESRLETARDDVDELFRSFFRDLLSPNKDMFVDIGSWNRLVERQDFSDHDESNRLFFVSLLRPEPFKDAILLGANIEDSLAYRWLTRFHDCRFKRHDDLTQRLRGSDPKLASRLKISYFLPGRHPSKTLYKKKTVSDDMPLIDAMDRLALETFGSDPFLYIANNDRKSVLDDQPNVVSIPVVAHGLNTYDQHRNIYFSAALNREPKHFEMLKSLGLESDHVHQASAHEAIYQGVMRTSLRDPTSSETVHAIVPDEFSAQRLATLVGTKQINQLGSLYSGPRPRLTKSQRNHRYEAKRSLNSSYATKSGHIRYINQECPGFGTFLPSPKSHSHSRWFVTFHHDPRADQRSQHHVAELSIPDFVAFLRKQARAIVDTKTDSTLFNPCLFNPPENAPGYRRKDYFRQSSFLVLDFDNGNLSPEEFERNFWHEAGRGQKRSFVICNSFSRAPDQPNKFRVILFYKRAATTLLEHEAVFDAVVARLQDHGFTSESAKLDPSCRSGVQSFYLPCTNRNHQDWAFFRAHGVRTRDLDRCAMDPVLYGKTVVPSNPVIHVPANPIVVSGSSREQIDAATSHLRSLRSGRHQAIFDTALELCRLGLSKAEVEMELMAAVGSGSRMRRKVSDALESLERYGWFSWRRPQTNTSISLV